MIEEILALIALGIVVYVLFIFGGWFLKVGLGILGIVLGIFAVLFAVFLMIFGVITWI